LKIYGLIISRIGITLSRMGMWADGRICWAYFASSTEEVMENWELREEMEQTMRELFDSFKGFVPNGQIPEGRNVDVECIRLTLDPIKSEHRPLAFYFVPPFQHPN
jgi:hypothetical protein